MKSYTVVAATSEEDNVVAKFKIKAPDESRAIEVAKRLKKEGKLDIKENISFYVENPK